MNENGPPGFRVAHFPCTLLSSLTYGDTVIFSLVEDAK